MPTEQRLFGDPPKSGGDWIRMGCQNATFLSPACPVGAPDCPTCHVAAEYDRMEEAARVSALPNTETAQETLTHAVNGHLIALYDAIAHTAGITREIAVAETGDFVGKLVQAMIENRSSLPQPETTDAKEHALRYAVSLCRGRVDVEAPYHATIIKGYIDTLDAMIAALPLPADDPSPRDIVGQLHCLRHCDCDYAPTGPHHRADCPQYRANA